MLPAVSVREVAVRAGVSVGTVSNVLNNPDKVSKATAGRVNQAIAELGFVPNGAAQQLRFGRSTSIGFVVLDVANPFFTDVARGAEARAAQAGLSLLLANSDERSEREAIHLDLFERQRVRGVLLTPVGDVGERLARFRARRIPVVLVDRADPTFSSVSVDDVAGGRLAAQHLIDQGARRIAFVGGPVAIGQVRDRLTGAGEAVARAAGVDLELLETRSLSVLEGRRAGEALSARPARSRPDAVFAANDLLAVGVLQAVAMLRSLRVPDDVALIGYDDIAFAQVTVVPLTSVRQPSEELGRRAVELLLAETDGAGEPQHVVFQPELIVRRSTVR